MTLDEAIKHCEEVTEKNEIKASWFWGKEGNPNYESCLECAKEHRQLATWLRELKQLKEQMSSSEKPNKWINKPQESEDEKVIRIKKGTLKARQGRFVIYDAKWLKEHFNTTEAKIYGQPSEDWNAVLDELNRIGRNAFKDDTDYDNLFDFISNLPNVKPQLEKRTEERTETHACDCISRKLMMDMGATCIAARNEDGDLVALGALDILPSATPQPKTGHWTHDGGYWKNRWICSECGYKLYDEQSKYCPNCGCRMQEAKG